MEFEFKQTQTDYESLKLYSKLLSYVFPNTTKYSVDFLNWQYNLNPNGKVIGYDAFFNGELAAHYVAIPVIYVKKNVKYTGLLSLNTATEPKYQGKGLFTQLATKTYDFAAANGYQFVIGVANQNSTPGFVKKLGFNLIAPLNAYIYLFDNISRIVPSSFFQSEINDEVMNWRTNNPSNSYLFSGDFVYSNTDYKFIKACLSKTKAYTKKNHLFLAFKMSIGLNNTPKSWLKFRIPDRLKPSPLNLIFKKLNLNSELDITISNTFFELIDFDAY